MKTKKILLPDQMIPAQWYNIVADMPHRCRRSIPAPAVP